MIFHFTVFFWSVAFFLGMQFVAAREYDSFWVGYVFSILFLSVLSLVSAKRITKRYRNGFVPLLISFSAPSLLSLVDDPSEKLAFSVIATGVYYVAFLGLYRMRFAPKDRTAATFLAVSMLSALFFFFAAAFGFYLNFAVPLASLVVSFALGSFGAAYQTLSLSLPGDRSRVALYSSIIAFGIGEIAWIVSFWPFGYLVTGAASLLAFYILWDMANSLFSGDISRKRTLWYLGLSFLLIALLLATSPWTLQV
ncbi:MAG: hypothetical protein HGA38_02495 [Candidatus Moranbacteria bacterium]|nr:hypothetical protein [Candidatus Moranbacteria bacterium]NTW45757.1 hypothetical protein [Candidatus Moranbacteria bacterium]